MQQSSVLEPPAACSGITIRVEKLDAMVLDAIEAIEAKVLTQDALDTILASALLGLADSQVDELATEPA